MFGTVDSDSFRAGDSESLEFGELSESRSIARPRRKRKFPGPAGILPDLREGEVKSLNGKNKLAEEVKGIITTASQRGRGRSPSPFSQTSSQVEKETVFLRQGPWQELGRELGLRGDENCPSRLMNIGWVQSFAGHLPAGAKVPFLMGVLLEAPELMSGKKDCQKKTPCVKIVDSTGTIEAAVDPLFVKMYGKELKPGTALAVMNAGLLHFKRNLILTITAKNVLCLASQTESQELEAEDKGVKAPAISFVTDGGVKICVFSEFSPEKVVKQYRELTDPNVIRQQHLQSLKNKQTGYNSVNKPAAPKLFTHIAPNSNNSNSNSELFVNFDEEDDDDELFRAFDMESTENLYYSQQQEQEGSKNPDNSRLSVQIPDNPVNQVIEIESEDEFDKELAAFDETTCDIFGTSQATQTQQEEKENFEDEFDKELAAFDDTSCDLFESSQATQTSQQQNQLPVRESIPEVKSNSVKEPSLDTLGNANHVSKVDPPEVPPASSTADQDDDSDFFSEFDRELDEL